MFVPRQHYSNEDILAVRPPALHSQHCRKTNPQLANKRVSDTVALMVLTCKLVALAPDCRAPSSICSEKVPIPAVTSVKGNLFHLILNLKSQGILNAEYLYIASKCLNFLALNIMLQIVDKLFSPFIFNVRNFKVNIRFNIRMMSLNSNAIQCTFFEMMLKLDSQRWNAKFKINTWEQTKSR